ncbi:MAG: hypothetical protein Q7T79_03440 [bacterium]|nr:hypothetical protein [bacterium]
MQNNKKQKLNLNIFFRLPIKKQEKIMAEVAGEANKDQLALVKRYEKQFGKTEEAGSL